ncbi:hypothetical protein T265_08715, partial [Opisthorchis viverrini]
CGAETHNVLTGKPAARLRSLVKTCVCGVPQTTSISVLPKVHWKSMHQNPWPRSMRRKVGKCSFAWC